MNSSLIEVIVNQLIGALIGVVVSFVVSWYFYKKADIPTRIIRQMIEQLSISIWAEKFGLDLLPRATPDSERPKDPDVPHIIRFYGTSNELKVGGSIILLFRVVDMGLNFDGDIKITDKSTGLTFDASERAYGYYSTEITVPSTASPGYHQVTFQLTDLKGKSHIHTLDIQVI
jgi:hypothetical protein